MQVDWTLVLVQLNLSALDFSAQPCCCWNAYNLRHQQPTRRLSIIHRQKGGGTRFLTSSESGARQLEVQNPQRKMKSTRTTRQRPTRTNAEVETIGSAPPAATIEIPNQLAIKSFKNRSKMTYGRRNNYRIHRFHNYRIVSQPICAS